MRRSLFAFMLLGLAFTVQAKISRVELHNRFYRIYNEQGREVKAVSDQIGQLVGYGNTFFIVRKNNFYLLCDEQGRQYKSLSTSIGEVVTVSGETFTVRSKGGFTTVYDRQGNPMPR